eukprot:TRINITY_DN9927_c0_g1_i1.p1 TRINITY_DN9927_c0_g1~~TRINITY_DN9927_c0_g1_i1.p1  ORF type:complete len:496 (+),score=94.20 TRINITY_DN9927_c0_g1_i1:656-2143(+)
MTACGPRSPPGWFVSKFDGRTRPGKLSGNSVACDVRCGEVIHEEERVSGFKALRGDVVGGEGLSGAAEQMVRLNGVLPNLGFPEHVTAFLMSLCNEKDVAKLEALVRVFLKLTFSADKSKLLPAFVLAQAFKKIFPTPAHAHLPPQLIGSLILIFIRGGIPHTTGCKAEVSLFEAASLLPKSQRSNTKYETHREGDRVWARLVSTEPIQAGGELILPPNDTLYEDVLLAAVHESSCGDCCAAPVPGPISESGSARALNLELAARNPLEPVNLPGRGGNGRVAFTIDGVFTPEECRMMSEMAFGSWESTLKYKQMLKTGSSDHYRLLKKGSDVTEVIWSRIHEHCPKEWNGWSAGGLNDRARFIQYNKGDRFLAHTDGEYSISEGSRAGWRSFITVQVYLTEGMEGGSTRFVNGDEVICDSVPKIGKVLVFEHCMRHTGEEVTNDVRKQIIRTEILYRPPAKGDTQGVQASLPPSWEEGPDGLNLPYVQHAPSAAA